MDNKYTTEFIMEGPDSNAIEWLEEISKTIPDLKIAWNILKAYHDKCQKELVNLPKLGNPFFGTTADKDRKDAYKTVEELLEKEDILNNILNLLGVDKSTVENILKKKKIVDAAADGLDEKIKELPTLESVEKNWPRGHRDAEQQKSDANLKMSNNEEWLIAKIIRLYNMHVKLGHSARITYLAYLALQNENIPKDAEYYELFKKVVLLSALFHDLGRFYQAIFYNSFPDGIMKQHEEKMGNEQIDHALAGYYFYLANTLEFNDTTVENDDDKKRVVTECIMAIAVKCHQITNTDMPHFDYEGSNEELKNLELEKAYEFINEVGNKAHLFSLDAGRLADQKKQEFINEFIDEITDTLDSHYNIIDSNYFFPYYLYDILEKRIRSILHNMYNKDPEAVTEEIMEAVRDTMQSMGLKQEHKEAVEEKLKNSISKHQKELFKHNVSSAIEQIFILEKESVPEPIRHLVASAVSITSNSDKIDILNQRAIGTFPPLSDYYLDDISIYPKPEDSLLTILKECYKFDIQEDQIIIDERIINILNNLYTPDKEKSLKIDLRGIIGKLFNQELASFGIEIYNSKESTFKTDMFKEGYKIVVTKNRINIIDKTGNIIHSKTLLEQNGLYNMFTSNWQNYVNEVAVRVDLEDQTLEDKKTALGQVARINSIKKDDQLDEQTKYNNIKKAFSNLYTIKISMNDLKANLTEQGYNEEDLIEVTRNLLVSEGLDERFKLAKKNPPGNGWIVQSEGSEHLLSNEATRVIWHLNQFVMVNIRSRDSLQYLYDQQMMQKIKEQYQSRDPLLAKVLEYYLDYCQSFIKTALKVANERHLDSLDGAFMAEIRELVSNEERQNKKRVK